MVAQWVPISLTSLSSKQLRARCIVRRAASWTSLVVVAGGLVLVPLVVDSDAWIAAERAKVDAKIAIVQRACEVSRAALEKNPGSKYGTFLMLCAANVGPHTGSDNVNVQAEVRSMNSSLEALTTLSAERDALPSKVGHWVRVSRWMLAGGLGAAVYAVCSLFSVFRQKPPEEHSAVQNAASYVALHMAVGAVLGATTALLATKAAIPEASLWLDGLALSAGLAGDCTFKALRGIVARIIGEP